MYVMGDTSSSCSSPEFVRSSDADLADSTQEKRLKCWETELEKRRIEGDEDVREWKSKAEKKTREMDERWKALERREREVDKRKREGDEGLTNEGGRTKSVGGLTNEGGRNTKSAEKTEGA